MFQFVGFSLTFNAANLTAAFSSISHFSTRMLKPALTISWGETKKRQEIELIPGKQEIELILCKQEDKG